VRACPVWDEVQGAPCASHAMPAPFPGIHLQDRLTDLFAPRCNDGNTISIVLKIPKKIILLRIRMPASIAA